ncbi:MAG: ribulose-phosphate 3-epimerase [Candidatus Wallbacteria bacterium]|nr:ribulose-phosphate 3-epimerase [Candidatus Wallbacteria bacterium]
MVKIAPSILSADFNNLERDLKTIEQAGADLLHLDVMDGHFVPNITFGYPVVKNIGKITAVPLDVHLMVESPEDYVEPFSRIKPAFITFQAEATIHPERLCRSIREAGCKAGISFNPGTPWETLRYIFDAVDMVLVMSVNPGFGGQKFIPTALEKITAIRSFIDQCGKKILIQVDGGVNAETAKAVREAGADILVAGSFVFEAEDRGAAVRMLRE